MRGVGTVPQHFRSLLDLGREGLIEVLDDADALKATRGQSDAARPLEGKTVVIILEKASTRTRLSFEVGIAELGGHPLTVLSRDTQLGRGEPLEDTARMLSRYAHAVVVRTFGQDRLETLVAHSAIPVINGLTDRYHPCQLLADLQTVRERLGRDLEGMPVAWIGDGNNMAHSWMLAAGLLGLHLRIACPEGYRPEESVLEEARALRRGSITITEDPREAARGARVVTTDVWASMGQEEEAEARRRAFQGFLVDEALMGLATDDAIFLHCLPAHRGEEVAASVIDGPSSAVWDEAENRLHAQKALLVRLVAQEAPHPQKGSAPPHVTRGG